MTYIKSIILGTIVPFSLGHPARVKHDGWIHQGQSRGKEKNWKRM